MTHLGRILIVDDEPKIRSFIGRALTAAGYATEFACSGAEALRSCAVATRYDLVILDLVMPDWTAARCSASCSPRARTRP